MKRLSFAARAIIFVCLAALLFAAFTHSDTLASIAILAPLCLLGTITIRPAPRRMDAFCTLPSLPFLPLFSPRPPPVQ